MAAYATVEQVEAGFRPLDTNPERLYSSESEPLYDSEGNPLYSLETPNETTVCQQLLYEAAVLIDSAAPNASPEAKCVVSCRMVRRALGDGSLGVSAPIGATQGSMAAGGYSQSWSMSGGTIGELYFNRVDKQLLGISNAIGMSNPYEGMIKS